MYIFSAVFGQDDYVVIAMTMTTMTMLMLPFLGTFKLNKMLIWLQMLTNRGNILMIMCQGLHVDNYTLKTPMIGCFICLQFQFHDLVLIHSAI